MADPIRNPGVPPIQPTKEPSELSPRVGAGEEAQEPKPFSFGPEPLKGAPEGPARTVQPGVPSPIELAGEGKAPVLIPEEELKENMKNLTKKLNTGRESVIKGQANLTPDHEKALSLLVDKLNPDMRTIANKMDVDFKPPARKGDEKLVDTVINWIDGSQKTLSNALAAYSKIDNMDPTSYFKLQMAVQRASEKAELFASIVGAGVSGVKTIMSMQLG